MKKRVIRARWAAKKFVRKQLKKTVRTNGASVRIESAESVRTDGSNGYDIEGVASGRNFFRMNVEEPYHCQVLEKNGNWRVVHLEFPNLDLLFLPFFP